MNETLSHALLRAGLTEDDIAARLGVDPKTVRRWLEGRALPYRRHRWALAALLGTAETDLWPQLRSARPRAAEVVAIYPHLGTLPDEVWLGFLGSAQASISLLDHPELPITGDRDVMTTLTERARAGVTIRICIAGREAAEATVEPRMSPPTTSVVTLDRYEPLRTCGQVQIRMCQGTPYNLIYQADKQLLAAQCAYGIPVAQVPVLHLLRTNGDMFNMYLSSFEMLWAGAEVI